jgi:hypothetical protein
MTEGLAIVSYNVNGKLWYGVMPYLDYEKNVSKMWLPRLIEEGEPAPIFGAN